MDMHSGGGRKEAFSRLYIQAPLEEAKAVFFNRFGHDPERITCSCCGSDYSIDEEPTLERATAYERGCAFENGAYVERKSEHSWIKEYIPLAEYIRRKESPNGSFKGETVDFIFASEIKPEERTANMPRSGSVWCG